MWGAPAVMPWQWGSCGGGKGKKGPPRERKPQVEWIQKPKNAMPDIIMLELPADSKLLATGICQNPITVIEHDKLDIFSEAHYFLQDLCGEVDIKSVIDFEHESADETYPEIHVAWKAAGHEENISTVAKCAGLQKCAIGMGGKKNAERAVKLALSMELAKVLDPTKVAEVCTNY